MISLVTNLIHAHVPCLFLDSLNVDCFPVVFEFVFGIFRRSQATTGHPIHGGRRWWVNMLCSDVIDALVATVLDLYSAIWVVKVVML